MDVLAPVSGRSKARDRVAAGAALGCFAVLCVMALSFAPRLVEPDDYAYRASIAAMTQGHFLTLSAAQADALAAQLPGPGGAGWCAAPAVAARLPRATLAWWLGSVVVFAACPRAAPGAACHDIGRPGRGHVRAGAWSFTAMRDFQLGGITATHSARPGLPPKGGPPSAPGPGVQVREGS